MGVARVMFVEYIIYNQNALAVSLVANFPSLSAATDCWADKQDIDGTIVPDKDRFPKYI